MLQRLRYLIAILPIILILNSHNLCAQEDKISYFSYQNLIYSNNQSVVSYSIRQKLNDSITVIKKDYILPDSLTKKLLAGINSIQFCKLKSNDKVVIDGIPFSLEYQIANQSITKIHGHPSGMQHDEINILNRFNSFISEFTNFYAAHFKASLPDGEYYKDRGMIGVTIEEKKDGIWYDYSNYPLVIFDGKIISYASIPKFIDRSDLYDIKVLKGGAATAIYGSQAIHGVILISSK